MILAPRSWPSSPGLAIRMRSRRSDTGGLSDPGRIAVDAEDLAEDVGDLADRTLGVRRRDHGRHEIVALLGRSPDGGEPLAHGGLIALPLAGPDAFDLAALDLVVDAQDLEGRRALLALVLIDADDDLLAAVELA